MHFSDFPASRIESKAFPSLTSKLRCNITGKPAFYTQQDVVELVVYAKARGVRVVPELDVPGHTGGLAPLVDEGLRYCNNTHRKTLYDDPSNRTWAVVETLIREWVQLFNEEELFHMGCDETHPIGELCGVENFEVSGLARHQRVQTHTNSDLPAAIVPAAVCSVPT